MKRIKTSMPRLGQITNKVSKPIFARRGFVMGRIVTDWEKIAGDRIAAYTQAEKISFPYQKRSCGTLHLTVNSGGALLIQHLEHTIIERVNTYFGYNAVSRLRIMHGVVAKKSHASTATHVQKPLPDTEKKWVQGLTKTVKSKSLQESLEKLGEAIASEHLDSH